MSIRMTYDRDVDVLLVALSKRSIDHAEEMGPVIVHFSKDDKPVALEILDARQFMTRAAALSASASTHR